MHRRFKENRRFNKILVTISLLLIVSGISFLLFKRVSNKKIVDEQIKELEMEIAKAESSNTDLKKMVEYLESDGYLEEQARLNFNLKKEGENVIQLQEPSKNPTSSADVSQNSVNQDDPNVKKWIEYFFAAK
ncbi:MAG: septum formation initiator family protein [Patescibacteria group bacterium]|nr:septum formation initiator family protein [Patescibacteria group bacterium]